VDSDTFFNSSWENPTTLYDTNRHEDAVFPTAEAVASAPDLPSSDRWGSGLLLGFAPPLSSNQIQQLSPTALAYLGDAVYELYIRRYYLVPPKRPQDYHRQVVAQVRAEAQSLHLQALLPHLSPAELNIVKRGRNAAGKRPHRSDPEIYQQATSLEALVGYLYLTDAQRLQTLLEGLQVALEPIQPPIRSD
jgi:ribonuclease III family protein